MQTAAVASTMLASMKARAIENTELSAKKNPDQLNIALIGSGAQGRILTESCLRIPGIRFIAVCVKQSNVMARTLGTLLGECYTLCIMLTQ